MISESITPGLVVFLFISYWVMFFVVKILMKMIQEGQGGYE